MLPHALTNFEIQKYYQNELKRNDVYSINNLPKIKDNTYVINLDEYESIGSHRIASYMNHYNVTCLDSFRVKYIPKEIKTFIDNKNITTRLYRIQPNDSITCGYICTLFIDFMQKVILYQIIFF